MGAAPNIESRVNAIARDLSNGKNRSFLLAKYGKKWKISNTSIDRLIAQAKPKAQSLARLAKNAADAAILEETKEAVKRGLRSVHDVDIAIQDIIFQKPTFVKSGKTILRVEHTVAEKLRAAMLYYKRHGYIGKDEDLGDDIEVTINGKPVN